MNIDQINRLVRLLAVQTRRERWDNEAATKDSQVSELTKGKIPCQA